MPSPCVTPLCSLGPLGPPGAAWLCRGLCLAAWTCVPMSSCPCVPMSPSQPCCANLYVPVPCLFCEHLHLRPSLTAWTCVPVSPSQPCCANLSPHPFPCCTDPCPCVPMSPSQPCCANMCVPVPCLTPQTLVPIPALLCQPVCPCPLFRCTDPHPCPSLAAQACVPIPPCCTEVARWGLWGWPFPRDDDSDRARARVCARLTAESRRHCWPGETEAGSGRLGLVPAAGAGAPGAEPRPRRRPARR